jgi:hypothetical protein
MDLENRTAVICQRATRHLVESGILEPQGVNVDGTSQLAGDQRRDHARVEATAQPRGNRDIAPQVKAHRFLEPIHQALCPSSRRPLAP